MRSLHPFLLLLLSLSAHSQPSQEGANPLHLPNDAVSLLAFKAKADLDYNLLFTSHFHHCQWPGVTCRRLRVVRFSVNSLGLRGTFADDTLTRLDQLRVLVLRNNSLSGRLPDLSLLSNLRSLLLDHNSFSGSFPFIFSLYKLRFLDLSFNNFSGEIPDGLFQLDRLNYLNLQFNHFNGSVPPLNQSDLQFFNVSGNSLSGNIPAASAISKFPSSSFRLNPNLCGEIISKPCDSFTSSAANQRPPNPSNSESIISPPLQSSQHKRGAIVLVLSLGALFLTSSLLCVFLAGRKQRNKNAAKDADAPPSETTETDVVRVRLDSQSKELKEKCKELVEGKAGKRESNNLVFCNGEENLYTLEQLLKATAEMLGTGTVGTTYKAKMYNELIVTVKRLDGVRMSGVNGEMFERHMDVLGTLRHPNLVPLRAYFQAKEERLIIYDYQPNGSVFNLIHGSRSTRAKPLHWTSCLKIAEDVAQGLCYIHQVAKLVHGNLKASNVLLGPDFEACITDFCLLTHTLPSSSNNAADSECDVYDFGVLLLEILSGKTPSEHPLLAPPELPHWVKAMREDDDDDVFKDTQLRMLVEVVSLCSYTYPQQRPVMFQVLKIIQKIKAMA